jgi:hypothetical protein
MDPHRFWSVGSGFGSRMARVSHKNEKSEEMICFKVDVSCEG